jgi:transcriptional regulator with XRE-family HTH domain
MQLADYLIENNMTQQALADAVGVRQSSVSKWLQGMARPSWPVIKKIKDFTNDAVTADDFVELPDYLEDEDTA